MFLLTNGGYQESCMTLGDLHLGNTSLGFRVIATVGPRTIGNRHAYGGIQERNSKNRIKRGLLGGIGGLDEERNVTQMDKSILIV